MRNVEIKARCADLEAMARAVAAAGAVAVSTIAQVDTYFAVNTGRLKLRQTEGAHPELIFYRRPDADSPKVSEYHRMPIAPDQPIDFILRQALGVRVVVRKRRRLWRMDNVRIHLDEVEGLGSFVEFEVEVAPGRNVAGCQAQARALMDAFGIAKSDLVAGSYADLLA